MTIDFITWPYTLRKYHSANPAKGACAMDAVNWLVHGKHGDHPECACPIISSYVIRGNDNMPDDTRQRLLPYLHRIAGSRSPEHESTRLRIMILAAARVFAPLALEKEGFPAQAKKLRSLSDTVSYEEIRTAARDAAEDDYAVRAVRAAADAAARAAAGADAAWTAGVAAHAAAHVASYAAAAVWNEYFTTLDEVLNAGPQGEPWSADVVAHGVQLYEAAI